MSTRPRLAGLDGIRGLAALYVVVNHVFLYSFPVGRAPFWAGWFAYGRFAVVVFIVLSGFSLGLTPARHGWRLDGVRAFARRRARRILPAYWAALAFSLAVTWLVLVPAGAAAPGAKSVLVNLFLVQNVVGAPTPNRAFWSLAVEAQLYLVFPLLLLSVRRWSAVTMVAAVTLIVSAVGIAGPRTFVTQSPPDLAALFALGILAAGIADASSDRRAWPWPWLALGGAASVLALIWWRGAVWTHDHLMWVDLALGPAVACLLASLATGRPARLLRLLDARATRGLGRSSYSLYLTHVPIVIVVSRRLVAGHVHRGVPAFVVTLALVLPVAIVFARVFAAVFEPPFRWRRPALAWGGRLAPVAMLAVLVWRLGTEPFLHGLRAVDGRALAAAVGLGLATTVCSAWRWRIVARDFGAELSLPSAVASYYRAMFLNVTLPGGVVGDVHRAVSHGVRAVVWERGAGQVVQVVLTVGVLLALPSPVRSSMPFVAVAVLVGVSGIVLVARARAGIRGVPQIALASALAFCGHAVMFLVAARTAGTSAPLAQLLPLALLVLTAMVLPNIGGWGPREGAAAWAFGAAGLGAQQGVATAVVYGVMVFVATLPGLAVLLVAGARRLRIAPLAEGGARA